MNSGRVFLFQKSFITTIVTLVELGGSHLQDASRPMGPYRHAVDASGRVVIETGQRIAGVMIWRSHYTKNVGKLSDLPRLWTVCNV